MAARATTVEVEGRSLRLTNLDKVLFPACGFTKGEMLDYYRRIAPVMLAHLAGRPITFLRAPEGVEGERFYEKRRPRGAPEWIGAIGVAGKERPIDFPVIDSLAALVWAASLAVVELHAPQWRVGADGTPADSDLLVVDLDPGAPAGLAECCQVALELREILARDGLVALAKVSGSKGLQLYASRPEATRDADPSAYAHRIARQLESERPERVVSSMRKSAREGRVLVDWSQNNRSKTTVAAYSLRARALPRVSLPVTWEEVEATAAGNDPGALSFDPEAALERVEEKGDLFEPLLAGSLRLAG